MNQKEQYILSSKEVIQSFLDKEGLSHFKFAQMEENWKPNYATASTARILREGARPCKMIRVNTPIDIKESNFFIAFVSHITDNADIFDIGFVYECIPKAYHDFIFYEKLLK